MTTQGIAIREEVSPEQFDRDIVAAQHKAQSLKRIVDSQGLSVRIGTSEHLKVEAWLTIAAGYGYSPRIAWSRPLPDGGYEAHAELVDSLGTVIGAGEAECGTAGDDNWINKPVFQQRSMAQTRATVRACRNKLAWVVVLAGYSPAPAEEMVAANSAAPKDNRYWCAEHGTEWFKRGRMTGYAHPIGDTKVWCAMKEARLDAKERQDWTAQDHAAAAQQPSEAHEPAARPRSQPEAPTASVAQPNALAGSKELVTQAEFMVWAKSPSPVGPGYTSNQQVMAVKGVYEALQAKEFHKAVQLLEAAKAAGKEQL